MRKITTIVFLSLLVIGLVTAGSFNSAVTADKRLLSIATASTGGSWYPAEAAGGVGTAAIQIGKALGARVIATAGTSEKLEICRQCGAEFLINYNTDDFVEKVTELTEGKGADVIYDPVGGDVFDQSTRCIALEGRILAIGFINEFIIV